MRGGLRWLTAAPPVLVGAPTLAIPGDQLGLAGRFEAGRLFNSCLDSGSVAKSFSFLLEILSRQATFEWDLQVAAEDGTLHALC